MVVMVVGNGGVGVGVGVGRGPNTHSPPLSLPYYPFIKKKNVTCYSS